MCRDSGNPCAHGAAVHCSFADALEENPFLLPALRGAARSDFSPNWPWPAAVARRGRDGFQAAELPLVNGYFAGGRRSAIALRPQLPDDHDFWEEVYLPGRRDARPDAPADVHRIPSEEALAFGPGRNWIAWVAGRVAGFRRRADGRAVGYGHGFALARWGPVATTVSRWTSNPAQRVTTTSTADLRQPAH